MKFRGSWVPFVILLFLGMNPFAANAALPVAGPVLEGLTADKQEELAGRKTKLDREHDDLLQEINAHNQKCGSVEADTPLDSECKEEMQTIEGKINRYKSEIAQYKKDNTPAKNTKTAQAPPGQAGVIGGTKGEITILKKDGTKVKGVGSGLNIQMGDKIITGPDSHIQLMLLDETVFTIGPNSEMVINEFVYDPASGVDKIVAKFTKGIFRWVTGKIGPKDSKEMKVDLPVDAVGIRGTDFETSLQPDGSGYIKLFSGRLDVTEKKTKHKVSLRGGQRLDIAANGSLGKPGPLENK